MSKNDESKPKRRTIKAQNVPTVWRAMPSPKSTFRSMPEEAKTFFDIEERSATAKSNETTETEPEK